MSKIPVGVIGVGSLGQHHTRVYQELENTELIGVFDADPARAHELAERHGCRVFPTLEDCFGQIEAASVAVPTDVHHPVAAKLLSHGIHLLVEKPLASTTSEAEDLVRLAKQHNCLLQVGHIERFNPVLSVLEEWPSPPRFIEAHRLASYPPPRPGLLPRGTEVSVVLDLMIHDIEVILHLVRSPVRDLRAVGLAVLSPSEDIANVRMEFENSCVANITASRISPERMRKIRVFFDDAYVSLDYQSQTGELHRKSSTGITREDIPIAKGDALTRELSAFAEAVRGRQTPIVTGEHASEALRMAAEITRLIREGRT